MKIIGRTGDDFDMGDLLVQMTSKEWRLLEVFTRSSPPEIDEKTIEAYGRFVWAARQAAAALDPAP